MRALARLALGLSRTLHVQPPNTLHAGVAPACHHSICSRHACPTGPVAEVAASPYPYPLPVEHTALVMIDFQRDFMEAGGFGETLGNNVALLRVRCVAAVWLMRAESIVCCGSNLLLCVCGLQTSLEPGARLLAAARQAGMLVVHTLEAHKADLSDLPPAKQLRGNLPPELRIGAEGDMGRILIRGEPGNGIVPEVAPIDVSKG